MMSSDEISESVAGWEGVTSHAHRFGGVEYRLGRRELGHVHGNWLVDIPFPKRVRDEVVAAGLAEPHHLLPDTGWVSIYLRTPQNTQAAIELLRRSYEIALAQQARRTAGSPPTAEQAEADDELNRASEARPGPPAD
jgi:hypothetical protein